VKKVAVGISGGVDSAVAALLLKEQGYDVTAVHLYCWPPKSEIEKDGLTREEWIKKNGCRADEDRSFALKTALELSIPFKVLDFSEEYNQKVIKYFYDEYEAGRTPNPDVMCNSEIKFGLFLNWALDNGFDYIATGHYAKLVNPLVNEIARPGTPRNDVDVKLMIPADKHKDQTYFLWKLTRRELEHTLFPLGELPKNEVRERAEKAKLSVAKRKDSQGICFVGNVEAREFLARRLKENPGKVLDNHGEKIGKHDGVWFYTIGQRGGWEITPSAQRKFAENGVTPVFYVVAKDAKKNILTVAEEGEAGGDQFEVSEINKISKTKWNLDHLIVRIRHGGELIGARGMETKEGLLVILDKEIRGIASGQSAVFYSEDGECLGGGVIA
jgi:tRNA-specific 2-thiouridylase